MGYIQRLSEEERSFWAGISIVGGVTIGLSLVILLFIGFPSDLWTPLPLSVTSLLQGVFGALGVVGVGILVIGFGQLGTDEDVDSAQDGVVINPTSGLGLVGGGLIEIYAIVLFLRYIYLAILLAVTSPLPSIDAQCIAGASFSSDGGRVAFFQEMEADGKRDEVSVWNLKDMTRVFHVKGSSWNYTLKFSTAALSPDGRLLAHGLQHAGCVKIWDVETKECVKELRAGGEFGYRYPVTISTSSTFSSDGSRLALAGTYGLILYDTADWTLVSSRVSGRRRRFDELAFVDNNRVVLAREGSSRWGFASLIAYKTDDRLLGEPVKDRKFDFNQQN